MNKKLRKTIIAGNWKMNMLASDLKAFKDELIPLIPNHKDWCEAVICTPSVLIPPALKAFNETGISVGAQNMSQHKSGAYTGEISVDQLADIGAEYVIIGHSERREYYGETDISVNEKLLTALDSPVIPIVCVGETLYQRETGVTFELVALQVKIALDGVSEEKLRKVVIAYEPVWAIGTGKTATPEDAEEVCCAIRDVLAGLYSREAADAVSILYGGSMNDKNADDLLAQPDIDGGLIGGASLKPESFAVIINAAR
ncbi:MAG: triose-phosphate isomerase [Oscillospiraceae bacterium]|jgi:triosephosphate isomerase|nr:triose-phosphate isomerase [Oscillospiraceae bacterium]